MSLVELFLAHLEHIVTGAVLDDVLNGVSAQKEKEKEKWQIITYQISTNNTVKSCVTVQTTQYWSTVIYISTKDKHGIPRHTDTVSIGSILPIQSYRRTNITVTVVVWSRID